MARGLCDPGAVAIAECVGDTPFSMLGPPNAACSTLDPFWTRGRTGSDWNGWRRIEGSLRKVLLTLVIDGVVTIGWETLNAFARRRSSCPLPRRRLGDCERVATSRHLNLPDLADSARLAWCFVSSRRFDSCPVRSTTLSKGQRFYLQTTIFRVPDRLSDRPAVKAGQISSEVRTSSVPPAQLASVHRHRRDSVGYLGGHRRCSRRLCQARDLGAASLQESARGDGQMGRHAMDQRQRRPRGGGGAGRGTCTDSAEAGSGVGLALYEAGLLPE